MKIRNYAQHGHCQYGSLATGQSAVGSSSYGTVTQRERAGPWGRRSKPMGRLSIELVGKLTRGVDADAERLKSVFKDIHQNPELGIMETRTAGIVAKELQALGYEVKAGIGETGVVGTMRNGDGPAVMYRGDMDAIAVKEATGLPYASNAGVRRPDGTEVSVAHLCGHDAHTTKIWAKLV